MTSNRSGFAQILAVLGGIAVVLGAVIYLGLSERGDYVRERATNEELQTTVERLTADLYAVRGGILAAGTTSTPSATSSTPLSGVPSSTATSIPPDRATSSTTTSTPLKASSTPTPTPLGELLKLTATSTATTTVSTKTKATSTVEQKKASSVAVATASPLAPKKTSSPSAATVPITARRLLDATTYAPVQRFDGTYRLELHTVLAANTLDFKWLPPSDGTLKVGQAPVFTSSFSCGISTDADQDSFIFAIRTPYTCSITLTGSGEDRWTKQMNFTTGPGLVTVAMATANPNFRDNTNESYLQITNTDDHNVAVMGLGFDFSFRSIDTTQPTIIRFSLGDTQTVFGEFSLQDAVADVGATETYRRRQLTVPVSMTVGANDRKAVRIQVLGGRHKVALSLPDPFVSVMVNTVTLDRSDLRIVGIPTTVQWSCTKTYDVNNSDAHCQ